MGELATFGFIVTGILPRQFSIYLAAGIILYILFASLEDSAIFFVRSIPLFLALPLAPNFDNFNTWRLVSSVIFLKFLLIEIKSEKLGVFQYLNLKRYKKENLLLVLLLILAAVSVVPAQDKVIAVKRIIYFVNLGLIGIVIFHLAQKYQYFTSRAVRNIIIPVLIVTAVGFIQLISTYLVDIYRFVDIWGRKIQLNQFGADWSHIAVELGNTWFAYYGDQLSLRVFSLFPDSHSFSIFLLLGLPAVFAFTKGYKRAAVVIPIYLIMILSGTRGIWAGSIAAVMLAVIIFFWNKKINLVLNRQKIFKDISLSLIVFFSLFFVAFPIFASPQFLLAKGDSDLLRNRLKSIINFGETSNAQRIEIWKKSFVSIKEKPIVGVGLGNFPVVLGQDISLGRAGSSAHNIYLHIIAEMGVIAGITVIWFLWLLFKKTYQNFTKSYQEVNTIYFGAVVLFLPWVLVYSLTDVALFDERAFSLFVVSSALILAGKDNGK